MWISADVRGRTGKKYAVNIHGFLIAEFLVIFAKLIAIFMSYSRIIEYFRPSGTVKPMTTPGWEDHRRGGPVVPFLK
jgi:hypothetical protein